MKEKLMKLGLRTLDFGAAVLGIGILGGVGYGALNVAALAVMSLAGGSMMTMAIVGAVVYPVAIGAVAACVWGAKLGLDKLFTWTYKKRQEIDEYTQQIDDVRRRGNEWLVRESLRRENSVDANKDNSKEIEKTNEEIIDKTNEMEEPGESISLVISKEHIENIKNKGKAPSQKA